MSREVRPQKPITDVRAASARTSQRSLREHPRPCATLARGLGIGRSGTDPHAPLSDRVVVVEARPPSSAILAPVVRAAGAGDAAPFVEARPPSSATLAPVARSAGASDAALFEARPPSSATAARMIASGDDALLVEEAVPC